MTLGGIGSLLALTAADARGTWLLFVVLAVLGLVAIWVERSLWAAAVPVVTAVAWAPIGLALADADSDWSLPLAVAICLLAALPGVLIAVLGAFALGERREKRLPTSHAMLLVVAISLAVGGCGGGSTGPGEAGGDTAAGATSAPAANATPTTRDAGTTPPAVSTPAASAAPPASAPAQHDTSTLDEARERMPGGDRRPPAQTLPSGAVVVPPPTPTDTQQPASDACAKTTVDRDGVRTSVEVPPAPGLRADVLGDAVKVTIDTGRPPARCAPDYFSVRIQFGTDLRAPVSRERRLRQLGEQTVTIPLPDAGGSVADGVVRATTGTDAGRIGPTAAIALQ